MRPQPARREDDDVPATAVPSVPVPSDPAPRDRPNPEPAPASLVSVRDVSLVFPTHQGPVEALADVSLDIKRGEFVSLIGPSGCGKTSLLRLMADLAQPTTGSLSVAGGTPRQARLERAYGYVFQAPALYPWRTALRNVMLPLEIIGLPLAERRLRAAQALETVGLTAASRRYPWQLSGGMQQRVSIARALSLRPELLLMDEPFGALDEITRDTLNLHLNRLWRETGVTVVFVTHSITEAVFLSSRIIAMSARPGRIARIIDCPLPKERELATRESALFRRIEHDVRDALRDAYADAGHPA